MALFARACLSLFIAWLPMAQQARAQESGVPRELAVSDLRQVLESRGWSEAMS